MPARKLKRSTQAKVGKATIAPTQGVCSGWKAELRFRARLPIVGSIVERPRYFLRVRGESRFPRQGFKVTLEMVVPQGINPTILRLQKVVKSPTGPIVKTPETVKVDYTMRSHKKLKYEQVTILPGGPTIPVRLMP